MHRVGMGRLAGRALAAWLVAGMVGAVIPATAAVAATTARRTTASGCTHAVLVLSAMPLELSPLVAAARLVPSDTVHMNGRVFYVGTLAGDPVVMAMTRIGVANAEQTTTDAMEHFHCSFRAVVFSGVAGSTYDIGDVAIPARWTLDGGKTWLTQDARMYKIASALAGARKVRLIQNLPAGDPACACEGPDVATPIHLPNPVEVRMGGVGETTDPFGGYAVPCVPGGGDIAGCEPCVLEGDPVYDASDFSDRAPAVATPGFLEALFSSNTSSGDNVAASDEETAGVATVAARFHVPFLGIRAVSDGAGDPLHLPGFPAEFFVYRQLAANNAAAVTIAFLKDFAYAPGRR